MPGVQISMVVLFVFLSSLHILDVAIGDKSVYVHTKMLRFTSVHAPEKYTYWFSELAFVSLIFNLEYAGAHTTFFILIYL